MKAKMVALKGINKVMVQNNMGMSQMAMNKLVFPHQLLLIKTVLLSVLQCLCILYAFFPPDVRWLPKQVRDRRVQMEALLRPSRQ